MGKSKNEYYLAENQGKKKKKKAKKFLEDGVSRAARSAGSATTAKHYSWEGQDSMPRGLLVILLFAMAALSFLSFVGAAGQLGVWIDKILGWIFGWGRYMMSIIFAVLAYIFLNTPKYKLRPLNYIGLVLFLLSSLALLHLFLPFAQFLSAGRTGSGGGYVGVALSYPLTRFTGIWATIVILAGLFVASWLIMFNTTLRQMFMAIKLPGVAGRLFTKIRSRLHAKVNGYEIETSEKESRGDETTDGGSSLFATPSESIKGEFSPFASKEVGSDASAMVSSLPLAVTNDPQQLSLIKSPARRRRPKIDIPLTLLQQRNDKPTSGDIEENKQIIQKTLENFGIAVEMGEVHVGPVVSQYTLKPAEGVKITQITTLHNDIALALAAHPVRIEAPIPGKSLVGIEVPNKAAATVTLRDMLESKLFKKRADNLTLCLGKDVSGKPYQDSLEKMPHLLIAGATGSGKSVSIHGLIISLLYQNSPSDLKLILVDPKRVELTLYNGISHLLTPVITDIEKTVNALKWTIVEMDRRYEILEKAGKRNIASYNAAVADDEERLPYIVFVIDELADLMSTSASAVEGAIVRLAQMSRAVGIHLVLATQRPSVNVITGLIKANMPARIAFSVTSIVDSRTILDFAGAEKLLGRGDMLYINAELSKPRRLQGALVEEKDISRVVAFLKTQAKPEYEEEVVEKSGGAGLGGSNSGFGAIDESSDELLGAAQEIIMQAGKASASLLQRRLRIGYARAARILDILEEQGVIGPADGAKPREILVNNESSQGGELPGVGGGEDLEEKTNEDTDTEVEGVVDEDDEEDEKEHV